MMFRLIFIVALVAGVKTFADVNLLTTPSWIIDGSVDAGPDPRNINIVVDKTPVGASSELKLFFNFDGTNALQVFSIKGSGAIQPSLPPPGVPGGVFHLTSYWDCEQGLIDPLAFTEMEFRSRGGRNAPLRVRGNLSNFNSLQATKVKLKFYRAKDDQLTVDIRYKLVATRDFCVDTARHANQDEFRIAQMSANFTSPEAHQNDVIRFVRRDSKTCVYGQCFLKKTSICANLADADGFIYTTTQRLGERRLSLLHTETVPDNTPSLALEFYSPGRGQTRPQGYLTPTNDTTVANALVWGNWTRAHDQYRAQSSVGRIHFKLQVRDPTRPRCDRTIGR